MATQMKVLGSHGEIIVDAESGAVLLCGHYGDDRAEYGDIVRFDVEEFRQWCTDHAIPADDGAEDIDILSIGFWTESGAYIAAEADWRNDIESEWARAEAEDCASGLHSWVCESGRLPPITACTRCGERYGNPS